MTLQDEASSLAITEIFLSIQGESTYAGRPCIFIRLAGCNLRCTWCDTQYGYEASQSLRLDDILAKVRQWAPVRLVEVTGGEPLLQEGAVPLLQRLVDEGYETLLETNGSLDISCVPDGVARIVDVKCPGSGEGDSFQAINLKYLVSGRDQLKFVLAHRADYEYARDFIAQIPQGVEALFSPVFGSLEPRTLAEWIVADRLPVRFHLQLHKVVWPPDMRGV